MAKMSHDHIFVCACGDEQIVNDCTCPYPVTARECRWCAEQKAYDRAEAARNRDY